MQLDPASYLRLDVPHSLGATAAGASFATSSGDILDVECFGEGIFRLRLGPNTRPDYGIVVARAKDCAVAQRLPGVWTFTSGDSMLEISGSPLRIRLVWKGATVPRRSPTARPRDDAPADVRPAAPGRCWHRRLPPLPGDAGRFFLQAHYGRRDIAQRICNELTIHAQVEDAVGVNTGLAYKTTPFAWSPGTGKGAWGTFIHTPGMVTHGIGYPDWSHRSYAVMVEEEALDLFLFAGAAPATIIDRYTQLTGRPAPVPRWSLGLWVSRASYPTPDDAVVVAAKLRARKIPADVLSLDGRSVWDLDTRFDFTWDPQRFADPAGTLAKIKRTTCGSAWNTCVSVNSPLFQELASQQYLLLTQDGDPYVFAWDARAGAATDAGAQSLPESGIVDFTNPTHARGARCAPAAVRGRRRRNQRLRRADLDDAVAFNGDVGARLHNVYPLLYNRCVSKRPHATRRRRMVLPSSGALRVAGSQRYPIGWGGDPQRTGRVSRRRYGRAVVHERQPVSQREHRRLLRHVTAVGRALRALAAGRRVRVAHEAARHRRPRAGRSARGRRRRAQVARDALPADPVSRAARRRSDATGAIARDAAGVSTAASRAISSCSSCAAMRCSSHRSFAKAATSISRCLPARGTT
jgi:alpha-D-xyloside xylohydrolase